MTSERITIKMVKEAAQRHKNNEKTVVELAEELGCSASWLYKCWKDNGIDYGGKKARGYLNKPIEDYSPWYKMAYYRGFEEGYKKAKEEMNG